MRGIWTSRMGSGVDEDAAVALSAQDLLSVVVAPVVQQQQLWQQQQQQPRRPRAWAER